ncbi:MAG TPA: 6-carboxytetrahydropterin synthase, partial [Thermoanaerobaculia bacterium]|nr:6-carboxytetrahydropterin synthase [Thermoanaerobaculia bacterium]
HGHNYRVRVHVEAATLDDLGMVIDFADLKIVAREVLDPFDHRVINDIPPFDERNTTAELFSEYVFQEVARRLADRDEDRDRVRVVRVEVWENDTACAVFEP